MRLLLVILALLAVDVNGKTSGDEETDVEWEHVACAEYDHCLEEYDELMAACNRGERKEFDDDDACQVPIRKLHVELLAKREARSKLLRRCYVTGRVEKVKRDRSEKEASVGRRHRGTCRQKFGELHQFKISRKNHDSPTKEMCKAAAKRLKERCNKIESCCPRIKSCRHMISRHPVVEVMRTAEERIKDVLRKCRESS